MADTRLPCFRTLDLAPAKGPWVSLGHQKVPPKLPSRFGAARYSTAQQQAHPDLPMTRLVKDVLRVGRWKVGERPDGKPILWNVTEKTLRDIVNNFALAQSRGVAMNLGKSHGDPHTRLIPTDELIAPIDRAIVEGDTLWLSVYVTPEQSRYLTNPAMKVSPGVFDNWVDGFGNSYPTQLIHVAVTDNPVVAGQGPFVALANSQSTGASMDEELLTEETTDTETTESDAPQEMPVSGEGVNRLIELISDLLPEGVTLPEDTSGDTLVRDLEIVVASVAGLDSVGDTGEESMAETVIDTPGDLPAELSNTRGRRRTQVSPQVVTLLTNLTNQVKTLSNEVCTLKQGGAVASRGAFVAKMQRLGRAGVPAKALASKLAIADRHQDYDLSLLDGLSVGVNMSNVARKKANSKAPRTPGNQQPTQPTGAGKKAFGPR